MFTFHKIPIEFEKKKEYNQFLINLTLELKLWRAVFQYRASGYGMIFNHKSRKINP